MASYIGHRIRQKYRHKHIDNNRSNVFWEHIYDMDVAYFH